MAATSSSTSTTWMPCDRFLVEKRIRMIVVGPEAPLVEGFHDRVAEHEALNALVTVIGPQALRRTVGGQ